MAGTCCGRGAARNDYVVTYADGRAPKTFTAAEGGVGAARVEAMKNKGASVKAVPAAK